MEHLSKEIDVLVYKLYNLDGAEIKILEQCCTEGTSQ